PAASWPRGGGGIERASDGRRRRHAPGAPKGRRSGTSLNSASDSDSDTDSDADSESVSESASETAASVVAVRALDLSPDHRDRRIVDLRPLYQRHGTFDIVGVHRIEEVLDAPDRSQLLQDQRSLEVALVHHASNSPRRRDATICASPDAIPT